MNGDACKFSHEPLTDESRQLLDKVESVLWCCLYVSHVSGAVFTAWCYASTVYVVIMCLVCLSHIAMLSKQLNIESRKQCCMIARDCSIWCQRSGRISNSHPQWGAICR